MCDAIMNILYAHLSSDSRRILYELRQVSFRVDSDMDLPLLSDSHKQFEQKSMRSIKSSFECH